MYVYGVTHTQGDDDHDNNDDGSSFDVRSATSFSSNLK